jgi:hypothetical protein
MKRGVCAIVTTREAGCDGRDGDAHDLSCGRTALMLTAKSCGPDTPTLVSSLAVTIRETTGQTSPVPGEITYKL